MQYVNQKLIYQINVGKCIIYQIQKKLLRNIIFIIHRIEGVLEEIKDLDNYIMHKQIKKY